MLVRRPALRAAAVTSAAALALSLGAAAPAQGAPRPTPPTGTAPVLVVGGVVAPLQLSAGPGGHRLYVADGFAGRLLEVHLTRSATHTVDVDVDLAGIAAAAVRGSRLWVVGTAAPAPGDQHPATLAARVTADGSLTHVVDLLAAERRLNPDRQLAAPPPAPGAPEHEGDAESNPYDVIAYGGGLIVADAGANALWRISPRGEVSVLTAFPLITTGECAANVQQLAGGGTVTGCDAVPTGLALGPDGYLYVSGLGSFAAGQVWKVDPRTGAIVQTITASLPTAPPLTDITVAPDGTIYVASPFAGAVFRLRDGQLAAAELPGAVSVLWSKGTLYVGAAPGVLAEGPGAPPPGGVYAVPEGAFQPVTP